MFGFFKKKESKAVVSEEEPLTEEQKLVLQQQITEKQAQLAEADLAMEVQAKLHEELGLIYAELNDEQAITELEKSLELKLTMGDGYKKLMSLYNQKRAEAARNGDDAGIEKYMNKMDDMRQIAKKLTISREN